MEITITDIIFGAHKEPRFTNNLTKNSTVKMGIFWEALEKQYFKHSFQWNLTLIIAYALTLIVGVVGNIMVILVVTLRPQMKTVTNMFIMNLAAADLFVVVFCVPPTLLANIYKPWILGSFMCKATVYVQGVSVCASAYSLVAISFDRWRGINRPMKRRAGISRSQAIPVIFTIWLFSLVLVFPWVGSFDVVTSDVDGLSYCIETWEYPIYGTIYYVIANLFLCYLLPLILITGLNIGIWWRVSHRPLPRELDYITEIIIRRIHRRTRNGVLRMVGIVTLTFLLSWLPLYILATLVKFSVYGSHTDSSTVESLMPFAQWLGSWNSCVNPVLYAFLNSKFRNMFKSLLPNWLLCCYKSIGIGNRKERLGGSIQASNTSNDHPCLTELQKGESKRKGTHSLRLSRNKYRYTLDQREKPQPSSVITHSSSPFYDNFCVKVVVRSTVLANNMQKIDGATQL